MIKTIQKLYRLLPPGDLWKLSLLVFLMLLVSITEIVGVGVIPVFVAILADPDYVFNHREFGKLLRYLGINTFDALFVFGMVSLVAVFTFKGLFNMFYHFLEGRYIWNRYDYISSNLFRKYMHAPYTFHLDRNSADLLRNITESGRFLVSDVLSPMLKLAMNVILTVAIIIMLIKINPTLTFSVFVVIGGIGFLTIRLLKGAISSYGREAHDARVEIIKSVNDGLGGFKDIRILKREDFFINRLSSHVRRYVKAQTFWSGTQQSDKPITEWVAIVGIVFISIALSYHYESMQHAIPVLALYGAAILRLMPAIRQILHSVNSIRYYAQTLDHISEDLQKDDGATEIDVVSSGISGSNGRPAQPDSGAKVVFDQVSYTYPNSKMQAVNGLSLSIQKGEVVGLAGSTGAGKTTVADLLMGLLKPSHGNINIDGRDVDGAKSAGRHSVSYIPQFIYLSDDTLRRNIAFGLEDEDIDDAKVLRCLEAAQLTDVVEHMEHGIHTRIGERGVRISGGQRQRIGIARALYLDADVIIMDEATSALDNYTENEVVQAIERLRGELTFVIIAHRHTLIERCDRIFFLENGKLAAEGGYQELIRTNDEFRKMALG
jgi:ABC-type multidrug transport system fused ATPase/permease subunit